VHARAVVFDFDGTLGNSLEVALDIYNDLARKRGLKQVTPEKWEVLRRGTIKQGLKELGIPRYQMPWLLAQGIKLAHSRSSKIQMFPGVKEVILELAAQDMPIFVLSTNSQDVVSEVLNKHGIGKEVEVLKSSRVFGKAKALRKLTKAHKLDPQSVWMVGDEVRDMEAAIKAGVHAVGVSWGFQPPETLKAVGNVQIIKHPKDLLKVL
jgi:phosphoglycolate phosphatase